MTQELTAHKADVTIPVYGTIADADVYLKEKVDAVLAEKDAEIAELKQKLESVQASMYADVVDTNMENRRLKRALWLARTWRAKERQRMLPNNKEFYAWQNVERKCRAKAEEYK